MPDLISISNELKSVPDQALASEMQNPTGSVPPYLVLAELQRRQLLRSGAQGSQAAQQGRSTVADDTLRNTIQSMLQQQPPGPPPPPGMTPVASAQPRTGMGTNVPGSTPPANFRMPPRMQEGGLVDYGDPNQPGSVGDYMQELQRRALWSSGMLMPGLARGGRVDDDDDDDDDADDTDDNGADQDQENGQEDEDEEEEPYPEEGPSYAPTAVSRPPAPATPPAPPAAPSIWSRITAVPHLLRSSIDHLIEDAAKRHDVPAKLVRAVAHMESRGNPNAVSKAGAVGVMQLMPGTAAQYGVHDRRDAAQNINAGAAYLGDLFRRYGGDVKRTLAAYNAGPGNVARYGGVPPFPETQHYVRTGLGLIGIPGFQEGDRVEDDDDDDDDATAAANGNGGGDQREGEAERLREVPVPADRAKASDLARVKQAQANQLGITSPQDLDLIAATTPRTANLPLPPLISGTSGPATAAAAAAPAGFQPAAPGEPAPPEMPATQPALTAEGKPPIDPTQLPDPTRDMPAASQTMIPSGDPNVPPLPADAPQYLIDAQQAMAQAKKNYQTRGDLYEENQAAIDKMLHPPDDASSRAAIAHLQDQIQKNLHPGISDVLLRMGFGLLASRSPFFGVALGEAGLSTMGALDKQQQEARQQWLDSIKMGVDLEDKRRLYETTRATLVQSGVNNATTNQVKEYDDSKKAFQKALDAYQKDPGIQRQHRFDDFNSIQHANGKDPITGPFDPAFSTLPGQIQNYLLSGKGTTTKAGAISPTVTVTKEMLPYVAGVINPNTNKPVQVNDQLSEAQLGKGYANYVKTEGKGVSPEEAEANAKMLAPIELGDKYDRTKLALPQLPEFLQVKARLPTDKWLAYDKLSEQSYNGSKRVLEARGKPVDDRLQRLDNFYQTLNQHNIQADAFIAPEILSFLAGGTASGLRMTDAEINRIVGGRTEWQNLWALKEKFDRDPNAARSISPAQDAQIRRLVAAVRDHLYARRDIINAANADLSSTQVPMNHKAITSAAETALTSVSSAMNGRVHFIVDQGKNKGPYDVPINEVYGFMKQNPQARIGAYHHFAAPGHDWQIPEEDLKTQLPQLKKQYPQVIEQ